MGVGVGMDPRFRGLRGKRNLPPERTSTENPRFAALVAGVAPKQIISRDEPG